MRLIFVHGWSVTDIDTYGAMPQALANRSNEYGLELDIQHIYLGRYISFHDEVTLDDIARAMNKALQDLPCNNNGIQPFSCITHSTGGPIVRQWVDRYYGADELDASPLSHLVMLAPANHGSALGKLGKARVGRIKAWFGGVEPGQRVLDWLSLGSDGQWSLNESYLAYDYSANGFYPFVLSGQKIDKTFYDFLNHYLVEKGSDGVVRVAGASLDYQYVTLKQNISKPVLGRDESFLLELDGEIRVSKPVALGVYDDRSHSGNDMGIMASIPSSAPVVVDILKCLKVSDQAEYDTRFKELKQFTDSQQQTAIARAGRKRTGRYCMLVFNIRDDQGELIKENDYDLFLLGSAAYRPDKLPDDFFVDRQMNSKTGRLVYYLDADKMRAIADKKIGFRVVARPDKGFSYYCKAEFHSDGASLERVIQPNKTTYIDIILHRFVDKNVFRFNGPDDFKKLKPSGDPLNDN